MKTRRKDLILTRLITVSVVSLIVTSVSHGFNLDTRIPVYKFGPKNSYFGFSVAEHVTLNKDRRTEEPVLLVGAPRFSQFGLRTGALFKCPLNTYVEDCENLGVDNFNSSSAFEDVDREDQWLGVTVKSQGEGGYAMVCAHRYVHKGPDFRWGNGICYSLTNFLDYGRSYEPCKNRLVDLAHEQYGYCQAGTSGEISKDLEILIGSPGPYTWRGTIFANNIRHSIKDDKTWYMGPVLKDKSPVSKYSYLGMSMAVGDFLGQGQSIFAGGAPRSNGTGQVVLYKKNLGQNLFETRAIINGEQFASSFGYTMTTLDADGDGHADLIVGAPFFYRKSVEGGAVYQYLSKDMKLGKFSASLKLVGKPESRFGFALANASDLNQDRYDDLAVGAPYERNGVVYIYLGGPKGLKSEPSQVIEATELPSPLNVLRTFGYSLSGNIDLDRNQYPDLLIGAYDSDAVVLLRSRPIVKIRTSVAGQQTIINPDVIGCEDDRSSKVACFSVQPCFQLIGSSPRGSSFTGNSLRYKIEAETFTGKKYYRVTFKNPADNERPNIVERTVNLVNGYNNRYCQKEVIYLNSKSDIQNSIAFKLTYSLQQAEPRLASQGEPLPNIDDFPILDQEEAQKIFYARFNKECGSDDVCDSNLVLAAHITGAKKVEASNYTLILRDENINLNVMVSNNAEPAYDTNVIIEHSSSLSFVRREAMSGAQVDCVPDSRTQLRCSLPNPFKSGKSEFTIKFSALNIQDYERDFFIKVSANTTSRDKSNYDNEVMIHTEVARNAELELSGVSEDPSVGFSGVVKGEYAMRFEDEIGNRVVHKYIIKNHGPWRAPGVMVQIQWPVETDIGREEGKWLLYITNKPTIVAPQRGFCDIDPRYVNPKNFETIEDRIARRYRREAAKLREIKDSDGSTKKVITLSCGRGARCITFKCSIENIEPNKTALIRIPSRLWNATLVEDYSDADTVVIQSHGEIKLNTRSSIIQSKSDDSFNIITKAYPEVKHLPPKAGWFWYFISIILGLLVLAIIVIILYKTGFFKRNRGYGTVPTEVDSNGIDRTTANQID